MRKIGLENKSCKVEKENIGFGRKKRNARERRGTVSQFYVSGASIESVNQLIPGSNMSNMWT